MVYRKSFVNWEVSTPPGREDLAAWVRVRRASQSGGILWADGQTWERGEGHKRVSGVRVRSWLPGIPQPTREDTPDTAKPLSDLRTPQRTVQQSRPQYARTLINSL